MRRFPPHHQPTCFPYAADLLPPRLARYANSDDQTLLNDAIVGAVIGNRTFMGSTARYEARNKYKLLKKSVAKMVTTPLLSLIFYPTTAVTHSTAD